MSTINELTAVSSVSSGDQVPVWSTSQGDSRRASVGTLAEYLQDVIVTGETKVTQRAAPSETGFSIQVNNASDSVWLIITPTAGFAAGTLVLPASTAVTDKQEILVNCTQSVATLTVNGNGKTVTGAPTALSANGFFRLRYDATVGVWYRVG